MLKVSHIIKASIMLAFVLQAHAQVDVVESRSLAQKQAEKFQKQQQEDATKANAQLFYQLQLLQDEVMRMQGMIEEQAHEIRVLKQQRLDDYVNLDKRIAELSQASAAAQSAGGSTVSGATPVLASASVEAGGDNDKTAYKAAYSLIREKKFDAAQAAFEKFSQSYPNSIYIPNSYYWLGELYIISEDLPKASAAFAAILQDYPDNRKYPEAMYKQAKVFYQMGERDKAKEQLDALIARFTGKSDNTVRLAHEFIQQHYP